MNELSDAIVVGGGPCGSFTALNLARCGDSVTVFEEHENIGYPSHCPGHLSLRGLKQSGLASLPEGAIDNFFSCARFYSPMGKSFSVRFPFPVTCAVDRTLFDQHIARQAENAGVAYRMNSPVKSLISQDNTVRGVVVERNGELEKHYARIVIDAEGISSRLLKQAGLAGPDRSHIIRGIEAEVEGARGLEPDTVEVFLGRAYAPSFYAWLIPKRNGEAKIGLGTDKGNPQLVLKELMHDHPIASRKLRKAKIKRFALHPITLGGPTSKPYASCFLVVGDAASQVKPVTGGGVIWGLTCARIASEVAHESLTKNSYSGEDLSIYRTRCEKALGFDARSMARMRRILGSLSDEQIEKSIDTLTKIRLDKTLANVDDVDSLGRSLLRILPNPRVLIMAAYLLYLRVSANL